MPYIPQEQRAIIDPAVEQLSEAIKKATVYTGTAAIPVPPDGAMNYAITRLIQALLLPGGQPSYLLLERVSGLLGCIDKEIYRRTAAPYENTKAKQNGDVFDWMPDAQLHTEIVADPRLMPKGPGTGQ